MPTYDAAFNISYQGKNNLGTDTMELFKDTFMPEVLAFRDSTCVMDGKCQQKSISSGKSATFPLIGRTTTSHHTPGALIQGNPIAQAETKVDVDFPVTAEVFVTDEDKAFSEVVVEGPYAQRLGSAMAKTEDQYRIRQVVKSARAANDLVSEVGGSVIKNCSDATGEAIYKAIKYGVQVLKEKDVDDEVFCILDWARWNTLFEYEPLLKTDLKGEGNIAEGTLAKVAGATVICSNNAEFGVNIASSHQGRYDVDMTNTMGLMFSCEAIAQVNLMGIDTIIVPKPENMGTLIYTRQMYGVGKHDPRCAVELSTAA